MPPNPAAPSFPPPDKPQRPSPSPPTAPSPNAPHPPYPPPAPGVVTTPADARVEQHTIQEWILSNIASVSGVDMGHYVDVASSWLVTASNHTDSLKVSVKHVGSCDYKSLYVPSNKLPQEAWHTAWQFAGASMLVSVAAGGLLAPLAMVATTVIGFTFVPVVLVRAYDIAPGCILRFPPLLPATLADDLYALVGPHLTRHAPWPDGLSGDGQWAREETGEFITIDGVPMPMTRPIFPPRDCTANPIGMRDGLRVLVWYLEYNIPSWRKYAPLATLQMVFGTATVNGYAFYYALVDVHEKVYADCAVLMMPTVPVVALLMAVAIATSVILLHTALFFVKRLMGFVAAISG